MDTEKIAIKFIFKRFENHGVNIEEFKKFAPELLNKWAKRFQSNNPEKFMDEKSKKVWKEMQEEGFK